jgi:hypothetical protein
LLLAFGIGESLSFLFPHVLYFWITEIAITSMFHFCCLGLITHTHIYTSEVRLLYSSPLKQRGNKNLESRGRERQREGDDGEKGCGDMQCCCSWGYYQLLLDLVQRVRGLR